MGFSAGDSNLYRYIWNRPVVARDPSGQSIYPSIDDIPSANASGKVLYVVTKDDGYYIKDDARNQKFGTKADVFTVYKGYDNVIEDSEPYYKFNNKSGDIVGYGAKYAPSFPNDQRRISIKSLETLSRIMLRGNCVIGWLIEHSDKKVQTTDTWEQHKTLGTRTVLHTVTHPNPDNLDGSKRFDKRTSVGVIELWSHGGENWVWGLRARPETEKLADMMKTLPWTWDGFIILSGCFTGVGLDSEAQVLANLTGRRVYSSLGSLTGNILHEDAVTKAVVWTTQSYREESQIAKDNGRVVNWAYRVGYGIDSGRVGSYDDFYREFRPNAGPNKGGTL